MLELWQTAVFLPNFPITMILGLVIVYWCMVILGALDIDLFHLDLDHDADLDLDMDADIDGDMDADGDLGGHEGLGAFATFLAFLNFGKVPFMIVFSVFTLSFWVIAILATHYFSDGNPWLALAFYLPNFLLSLLLTKTLTAPMVPMFRALGKHSNAVASVDALMCTLLSDTDDSRLSQGEVITEGAPYLVNIKARPGQLLKKGSRALIIEKDKTQDFYYVEHVDDLD